VQASKIPGSAEVQVRTGTARADVCLFVCLFLCVFVCLPEGALVHLTTKAFAFAYNRRLRFPFGQRQTLVRSLRFADKGFRAFTPFLRVCVWFVRLSALPVRSGRRSSRSTRASGPTQRRVTPSTPRVLPSTPRVLPSTPQVPLEYPRELYKSIGAHAEARRPARRCLDGPTCAGGIPSTLGSPRVRGTLMCAFLRFGRCVRNRS
jgi:hypothetical protein